MGGSIPAWLCAFVPRVYPSETVIAVASGRAKEPSTTHVRSIIVYPARDLAPDVAYVYIEEWPTGARVAEPCMPFHVIRCAALPERVRFVEVPCGSSAPMNRSLRPV